MTQLIHIGCLCKKTLDFSLGALTDLVDNIKKSLYMYLYCILIDAGSYASIRYFMNIKNNNKCMHMTRDMQNGATMLRHIIY